MKAIKGEKIGVLVESNEVSKTFKHGNTDVYLAKAYDESKEKHHVVISIPKIEHLKVVKIQWPFEFDSEKTRDEFFNDFEIDSFMDVLEKQIKQNNRKLNNGKK